MKVVLIVVGLALLLTASAAPRRLEGAFLTRRFKRSCTEPCPSGYICEKDICVLDTLNSAWGVGRK